MTVAADAQDLQIDAPSIANALLVGGAVLAIDSFDRAIGNMNVGGRDVHARKKVLAHEVREALRMIGGKSKVLVEIEGDHAGKIEGLFPLQASELLIHADGRAAGRQTETESRVAAHGARDHARRFAADLFGTGF